MKNKDNKENFEPLFEIIEQIENSQSVPEKLQETIINDEPELQREEESEEVTIQNDEAESGEEEAQSQESEPVLEDDVDEQQEEIPLEEYSLDSFAEEEIFEEPVKKRGISGWWKARKTWQKALMISFTSFVLVFAILLGVVLTVFDYNYNSLTVEPEDLGFQEVIEESIVNVALFGIDTRSLKSFEGNSDSIMILSLNTKTKKVKIMSVMRDTLVPITYNGKTTYGKINGAYSKGGPELAIKTINTIFGLDISEYATVNFYGMVDIIDAVGGIEAELTQGEVTKNTNIRAINFCINELCKKLKLDPADYRIYTPGKQTLNGVQAVAYSRIRYVQNIWGTNNDYGRTDRQRHVMEQLFNKALTLDKSKYIKLAKSLIPCSETSLSYTEIIDLAFKILLESPTFEQTRIPQEEFLMPSPSGSFGSVVYYDLNFAKKLIHAFIYDDIAPEKYVELNGIEKYDWYANRFSTNSNPNGGSWNSGNTGDSAYVPDTNNGYGDSYGAGTTVPPVYDNGTVPSTPETVVPDQTVSDTSDVTSGDDLNSGNASLGDNITSSEDENVSSDNSSSNESQPDEDNSSSSQPSSSNASSTESSENSSGSDGTTDDTTTEPSDTEDTTSQPTGPADGM